MKHTVDKSTIVVLVGFVATALWCRGSSAMNDEGTVSRVLADWQELPEDGVIAKPGRYFLRRDMETNRSTGIKLEADDVTIDLCGHALRYTGTPQPGIFGITASDRTGITICNGTIGGFWFNIHCTQNKRLRIRGIHFDDIPYIGANVAQSIDVGISDNLFDHFRYDLKKDKDSTYVVGINIGAEGAVIASNRFIAELKPGAARDVDVETVFVLFSAQVTKDCLVARNTMTASEPLPRSYGVWIANNAQASVIDNSIRNLKFGVCLASDASGLVCFNRFKVEAPGGPMETIGISAVGARDVVEIKNTFEGLTTSATLPKTAASDDARGG
jgi:hypothetical protein